MASERCGSGRRRAALAALLLLGSAGAIAADGGSGPRIYRCIVDGKKVTRDRPIAECSDRVQYLLNTDGSVRGEVQPTLTVEEREKKEQEALAREINEARLKQEARIDRNLKQLYPNEEAHAKARNKALEDLRFSVRKIQERIAELNKDRKPLLDELEFYEKKPVPSKLKAALDANDASLAAQRELVQNQQAQVSRINATFDVELARLRKLWAGAPPGSLGPLPGTPQTAALATPAVTATTGDSAAKTTTK